LERIVRHCLEKKPELRFQSARDLGFALEAMSSAGYARALAGEPLQAAASMMMDVSPSPHAGARAYSGWRDRIGWITAGMLALALLALGVAYVRRPALEAEPMRFSINAPERATYFDFPTISPDGRTLSFVAEVDGKTQLWVRALGATTARPLIEVRSDLPLPFWSPDSQFIAYFDLGKLKKIPQAGGTPETLCEAPTTGGGTWNRDGVILVGNATIGIRRVSANGGNVTAATSVDTARGDTGHMFPIFLPDGRHFLYHIANPDPTKSGIYHASLEGGESRRLLYVDPVRNVGVAVNPADQSAGYLTFVRQGALLAQSYDFSRNQLVGEPVRIAEHVAVSFGLYAHYSLATNGALMLLEREADQQLVWFDRAGKKLGTVGQTGQYFWPRLSPDGQRVAVARTTPSAQMADIHLFDLASGAGTPFTFDPSRDERPIWSPDGSRIVWAALLGKNLFQKAASGAGQDEVLLRSAYQKWPSDWSADGRFILYTERSPQTTGRDLWVLPMESESKPWPWLSTPADERQATFSPDEKWIAYQSDESGRFEIYLQAFVPGAPASSGKRQLSTNGGTNPRWRRDGRELYYLAGDGKLMAVGITPGAELKAGTPKELFAPSGYRVNDDRGYTLTGDGQRFLFVTSADDASVPPFTVVLNWMAEVKR
ncbi:MAG: hypothetical protein M3X11_21225, partial [Acidobacteriota bacterium]|nr:hypothetical protein [Acidobacteriota bacterium]